MVAQQSNDHSLVSAFRRSFRALTGLLRRRAARALPADTRKLCGEGFQHFANDRIDEAIDCYRRAVDADPQLAIAWSGLSRTLQRKGDLDEAVKAALKLIDLEPQDPLSHTNLSILYQMKGLIQEAEDEGALAMQLQVQTEGESKT